MQNARNKKFAVAFWVLSVLCMAVIFYLSSRTANESASQSGYIIELIKKLFGTTLTDFLVRKSAHCLEFSALAFLLSFALFYSRGKTSVIIPLSITSLYAASDEVHQLFVNGRSGEVRDWAIDTAGALFGIAVFFIVLAIKNKIDNIKK